ncbi:hypothetical protein ACPSM1_05750 [Micromonospora chersina]|uniref:hypothetical protein n=1 Tax=Micromonospora chersina TaxID=47854 RepID=UPI003C971A14
MVGLDGGHRLEWILYFGGEARELQLRAEIDYPLTDEPWGLRRFFVRDPNGTVANVRQRHG